MRLAWPALNEHGTRPSLLHSTWEIMVMKPLAPSPLRFFLGRLVPDRPRPSGLAASRLLSCVACADVLLWKLEPWTSAAWWPARAPAVVRLAPLARRRLFACFGPLLRCFFRASIFGFSRFILSPMGLLGSLVAPLELWYVMIFDFSGLPRGSFSGFLRGSHFDVYRL